MQFTGMSWTEARGLAGFEVRAILAIKADGEQMRRNRERVG